MARPRKFTTSLSDDDRAFLEALVKKPSEQVRRVQRARVMLLAHGGRTNDQIAEELGISTPTVVKVLKKLNAYGVEGALADLQRSGRSTVIQAGAKAWVISLACSRPSEPDDGPAAQLWSVESLRKYIVAHCENEGYPELAKLSVSTVWEIVRAVSFIMAIRSPPLRFPTAKISEKVSASSRPLREAKSRITSSTV